MGFIDWARDLFRSKKLNKKTTPAGTIEKEFGVQPAASRRMTDAIDLWYAMYTDHPPWETCDVRPLGLPQKIGLELARHAMAEFSIAVSGSARAEYIDQQMQLAAAKFVQDLELGLCLGGVALRPYPDGDRILVEASTTGFTPTRFDGTGRAVGGVFKSDPVQQGKEWFVKLEHHDLLPQEDGSTVYVIEHKAFRSGEDGGIGAQVPLDSVAEWAGLQEYTAIEYLEGPLFAYFKPPASNTVDPSSKLGTSIYAGATVDLIQQADEQWYQLRREYKTGKRRMVINGGVMDASQADDEIYEYGRFNDPNFFQFINPDIRDEPLYNGFQRILQRIEFNVGLAFGTISDPQSIEKTATEVISARQRQFVTEKSIQKAFRSAIDDLAYAMDAWCDLAQLAPKGYYEVAYNWGDGILDDPETRRQDMALDMQRVSAGLMRDVDFVMKWDKVDEATARKMLPGMEDMTTEEETEIE